jgi:Uma2 family endonuclease
MKAVMSSVPPEILERRKRLGLDRWDEMWNGVLHMPPMPNRDHQYFEWSLETFVRYYWARPGGAQVYHGVNLASIGGWPGDYRVPDIILLTPERFAIDKNEYFEGAPDVVVEIHSPGDETYDKLPFYRDLEVPEVWIIDRDTKEPEVLVL